MDTPLVTSAYVFVVVFGFLSTIAFALRLRASRGVKSTSSKLRVAQRAFATEELRAAAPAWPARSEDRPASRPVPRDDLDYHHGADFVIDPRSSYPIPQPPRGDEGAW